MGDDRVGDRTPAADGERRGADRRRGDRRKSDRRREDRRAPPPIWRRPAAYVMYGVVGTALVAALLRLAERRMEESPAGSALVAGPVEREIVPEAETTTRPPVDAYTLADFERLLAEGDAAVGSVVRTELYCEPITQVLVRTTRGAHPSLARMADGESRVGAAECRWSADARSSDFLLVIPAELAEEFSSSAEVELKFVRRRRIRAEVEWLGRLEELALRTAGILRAIDS